MADRSAKRAYDPRKPQANILSVQSSEGLEFRSVIFIALSQIDTLETQAAPNMKRLMTRAKERLPVTASARKSMTESVCASDGSPIVYRHDGGTTVSRGVCQGWVGVSGLRLTHLARGSLRRWISAAARAEVLRAPSSE